MNGPLVPLVACVKTRLSGYGGSTSREGEFPPEVRRQTSVFHHWRCEGIEVSFGRVALGKSLVKGEVGSYKSWA